MQQEEDLIFNVTLPLEPAQLLNSTTALKTDQGRLLQIRKPAQMALPYSTLVHMNACTRIEAALAESKWLKV